jgi:hypothetical protein
MKKLLFLMALLPGIALADCGDITGDWIGKSTTNNKTTVYTISINPEHVSVTALEPERATRTITSTYTLDNCQLSFKMWYNNVDIDQVILNLSKNHGYGYIGDPRKRNLLEITR